MVPHPRFTSGVVRAIVAAYIEAWRRKICNYEMLSFATSIWFKANTLYYVRARGGIGSAHMEAHGQEKGLEKHD
jgi:hypothetical protein